MSIQLPQLLPSLLLAAAFLIAPTSQADIHPTDRCVSEKLAAAAHTCEDVLRAVSKHDARSSEAKKAKKVKKAKAKKVKLGKLEKELARTRAQLARAWSEAEAASADAGVDCAVTTVTSEALVDQIEQHASSLAAALADDAKARRMLSKLGGACSDLLAAESRHLLERDADRDRARLDADRERALAGLNGGQPRARKAAAAHDLRGALDALVEDVIFATTVSPHVPEGWTLYEPQSGVEYRGRTLSPICSGGTPYVFFARRGTVNKLVVYYQGGGACWNNLTCGGIPGFISPTFKQSTGEDDHPDNFPVGFNDFDNPDNPFRDWSAVFIPYCTGDVHWGDATVVHESTRGDPPVTKEHKGFVNAQYVEKWTREHFVHPEQVFVTGSSAGAYGAIFNSVPLQEFVYPSSRFAVLGDAGNGVITQEFLEGDISKWGIEKNLPRYIPGLDVPLTELTASDLYVFAADFYPGNRFATYTSAFDGGTGGQTGFYNIMLNPGNPAQWISWWNASCEWNDLMLELNRDAASRAPNFRFYVGAGSAHTMWGRNKVYTDTTGNVPTIVEWIRSMLEDDLEDWENVLCEECRVVLSGDPTPPDTLRPQQRLPFTTDGRIACE